MTLGRKLRVWPEYRKKRVFQVRITACAEAHRHDKAHPESGKDFMGLEYQTRS